LVIVASPNALMVGQVEICCLSPSMPHCVNAASMDTLEGSVSHLQNTIKVTGGGENRARTTYIALFRLDGQPVQFSASSPIAIAEGDCLMVSGSRTRNASLTAYACKNLTTGATMHSGIWGNVILAAILPLFGLFFCFVASFLLGKFAVILYLCFLAGTVYLLYSAFRTSQALSSVQNR
jgi:hypothetical protein